MKKLFFIAVAVLALFSCKKNNLPDTDGLSVTVGVRDVTDWSATMEGRARALSWWHGKRCGFLVSAGKAPTWEDRDRLVEASTHDFPCEYSVTVNGLLPETTYYYRAVTWYNDGYQMGDTKEFRTKAVEASITTEDGVLIGMAEKRIKMRAHLNYDKINAGVPINVWFYFIESDYVGQLESEYAKNTCSLGQDGYFELEKAGIESYKKYFFKPAAEINGKVFYGPTKSYDTPDLYAD